MVDCPKCLKTGEVFTHNRLRTCNLCDGSGEVSSELSEDYVSSLQVFDNE